MEKHKRLIQLQNKIESVLPISIRNEIQPDFVDRKQDTHAMTQFYEFYSMDLARGGGGGAPQTLKESPPGVRHFFLFVLTCCRQGSPDTRHKGSQPPKD